MSKGDPDGVEGDPDGAIRTGSRDPDGVGLWGLWGGADQW